MTSSATSLPERSRRFSAAGASSTSRSSSKARSQVAKGVTPSGWAKKRAITRAASGSPSAGAEARRGLICQSSRSIWSFTVSMASRTGSTLANPRSSAKLNGAEALGVKTVLAPTLKSSARTGWGSLGVSGAPGENMAPGRLEGGSPPPAVVHAGS